MQRHKNRLFFNYKRLLPCVVMLYFLVWFSTTAAKETCDAQCLEGHVSQYLEALKKHDSSILPLADDVRFTENTIRLNLNEGMWGGAVDGFGPYKTVVTDLATQQAAYFGVVMENGVPSLLGLRLRIKNGEIKDIETTVARDGMSSLGPAPNIGELVTKPIFTELLKAEERVTRQEMIAATNQYFEGIEQNSGDIVPFDDACNRTENGIQTTNVAFFPGAPELGCKEQFNSGGMFWQIKDRRYPVVDEERGLVLAVVVFSSGLAKEKPKDPMFAQKMAHNVVMELFKIKNGRIYEIDAVMGPMLPYGQEAGW